MLLVHRIHMRASTRKSRTFALAHRVEMHGMEPGRQLFDGDGYDDPILDRPQGRDANAGARGILDIRTCLVLRVGARQGDQEA
jgi:hypothetical protein